MKTFYGQILTYGTCLHCQVSITYQLVFIMNIVRYLLRLYSDRQNEFLTKEIRAHFYFIANCGRLCQFISEF